MLASIALALLAQTQAPGATPAAGSYGDPAARDVVLRARAYYERLDRSITRYEAVAKERISVGIRALRSERLFFRRETATKIDWRRDGVTRVEVVGARQVIPAVFPKVGVAEDADDVRQHVFDPTEDRLFLGVMDSSFVYHPFAPGSEAHYRFSSADTTEIRLADGRVVRLYGLEVQPLVQDVHHFIGTVWVDAESFGMVRAIFRLADAFDLERDSNDADADDVPGVFKPIRAEVSYFTVEYGLWELHWWMPRLIAFEAVASVGGYLRAPLRYERTYSDYRVEGDTAAAPLAVAAVQEPDPDSVMVACFALGHCRCGDDGCSNLDLVLPEDTLALIHSTYLPASIYDEDESLMTEGELNELADHLRRAMPSPPWQIGTPEIGWGLGSGLLRYNRIEGLSVGARAGVDFGPVQGEGVARIGLAELEPEVEISALRDRGFRQHRITAYRRLAPMNPWDRPLGLGNSIWALTTGQDDGEYFRALGIELAGRPTPASGAVGAEWRLFAEWERPVDVETQFSLRHALNGDHLFRGALAADRAAAYGAAVTLRHTHGLDPSSFRWGAELELLAAAGTFDYGRAALTLRAGTPLPGAWVGSVEAAAGSSAGDVPVQGRWFLGGPATVRGYRGAFTNGEAFWRVRAEVGTSFPAARLTLFGDAGWAGDRTARRLAPGLVAAGIGGSILDGLLRIDLARALEGQTGWRLHLYVDGIL